MVSELIQKRMIACSQSDDGIKYSDDYGKTWKWSNLRSGGFSKPIQVKNGVWLVCASGHGSDGIYRSEDGGKTWNSVYSTESKAHFKSISKLAGDELIAVGIEDNVKSIKSLDNGLTWEEISSLGNRFTISRHIDLEDNNELSSSTINRLGCRSLMDVLNAKSLIDLCEKLQAKSNARDYSGLMNGDWFDIPEFTYNGNTYLCDSENPLATDYQRLRMEICGFGTFDGVGDTNSGPGILFQCKNIPFKARIHSSDVNTHFNITEMYNLFKECAISLGETLGVGLKSVHRYYKGAWCEEKIFLPGEPEVFSDTFWSEAIYQSAGVDGSNSTGKHYTTDVQWEIFGLAQQKRIKSYNGSRRWWWECSPASTSGSFCLVDTRGSADCSAASNADTGVSFACYI